PIRSDCMAIRLRSRQVNCITGSCPNSYRSRQTGSEPARTTAAVLSVTFTPCTRPTSCLALSRTDEMLVPLGGLYSTVTANVPRLRTSIRRCGSRLIDGPLIAFLLPSWLTPPYFPAASQWSWGRPHRGQG